MSERVAIIDYGSGNLKSAQKAFLRAAAHSGADARIEVTSDPEKVRAATRIVLPGVGAFGDCRTGLLAIPGMAETLKEQAVARGVPFLGICVGMQLMAETGHEKGMYEGLGWIGGNVEPIVPADPDLKVPHMGWNTIRLHGPHPLFEGIKTGPDGLHAYFVHSYQVLPTHADHVLATTDYQEPLIACIGRDNLVGTQFHPEKSQRLGLGLISNFLKWRP